MFIIGCQEQNTILRKNRFFMKILLTNDTVSFIMTLCHSDDEIIFNEVDINAKTDLLQSERRKKK